MGMARSFQDTRLFRRLTVLENVAMAVPHQTGENIASLAVAAAAQPADEAETLAKAMGYLELIEMAGKAHERGGQSRIRRAESGRHRTPAGD